MIPCVKKVQRSQKQVRVAELWLIILFQNNLVTQTYQSQTPLPFIHLFLLNKLCIEHLPGTIPQTEHSSLKKRVNVIEMPSTFPEITVSCLWPPLLLHFNLFFDPGQNKILEKQYSRETVEWSSDNSVTSSLFPWN